MKKRGGTMTCHIKQLLSISLFAVGIFLSNAAFGILFSNAAQAQCKPTLYLFRHAEDVDRKQSPPPLPSPVAPATGLPELTSVGATHAKLYPDVPNQPGTGMISQLQTALDLCPVMRVFAMWDRQKSPTSDPLGTTNPYNTALPLARAVTPAPSITAICPPPKGTPAGYTPEMCFQDDGYDLDPRPPNVYKYYLCEYPIENGTNCEMDAGIPTNQHRNALFTYPGQDNPRFYSYLLNYFQTTPGSSVAIFYTSQGMPAVSAIIGGTKDKDSTTSNIVAVGACVNNEVRTCTEKPVPDPNDRTCTLPWTKPVKDPPHALTMKTEYLVGLAFKEVQSTYFIIRITCS
jgi:hypothetical protein